MDLLSGVAAAMLSWLTGLWVVKVVGRVMIRSI